MNDTMNINCDQCGKHLHPEYLFCPYCGAEAPRKTRKGDIVEEQIENPLFCPACRKENLQEAMFCSSCGEGIFSQPSEYHLYCPACGEKNSSKAKICYNCALSLFDWFAMKGVAAEKSGHRGDLTLYETMNCVTYRFITRSAVRIGRNHDNDIVIPCGWVSGNHAVIDLKEGRLKDFASTNGTYINRNPEHVTSVPLDSVKEFNIAGFFTFKVVQTTALFSFRLTAILEENDCRENGDGPAFDRLRKINHILLQAECELLIGKTDGVVSITPTKEDHYFRIKVEDGFYYLNDKDRNIDNLLILKAGNNLPVNWKKTE